MRSRFVIVAAVAFALALGLIVVLRHTSDSSSSTQHVDSLRDLPAEQKARIRAPTLQQADVVFVPAPETRSGRTTNLFAWLSSRTENLPQPSRAELEPFLAKNRRSVEALLGALRASGDHALLAEAKERFADDPRVQFAAVSKSDSPEERRQWLEKLKQSAPDNALASYLLAGENFKAGRTEQALQELTIAGGRPALDNYILDFVQNTEEAYRAAGYSDAEAKGIAATTALIPELAPLKQVGLELRDMARRYQEGGDEASAQAALQMALNLAHRLNDAPQTTLIQELVGIAVERLTLNAMNPGSPYGESGKTVQEQSEALDQRRKSYRELVQKTQPILMQMSDEDMMHYFDRAKLYGEVSALRWVLNQSPRE